MGVDLRQVVAGILTLTMFVMLGNMIKRDHFDSVAEKFPGDQSVLDNAKNLKQGLVTLAEPGRGPWRADVEELKPCWSRALLDDVEDTDGYVIFSLTNGPEYYVSQIAEAVVVARYLGATLVLPDIRGSNPGDERVLSLEVYAVDMVVITSYKDMEKELDCSLWKSSCNSAETVVLPGWGGQSGKKAACQFINKEDYISEHVEPVYKKKGNIRLATYFPSVNMKKADKKSNSNSVACLAMFGNLELQYEIREVVDSMVQRLKTLSRKSDGQFVAVDLRVDILQQKGCQGDGEAEAKSCYNAQESGVFVSAISGLFMQMWLVRELPPVRPRYLYQQTFWIPQLQPRILSCITSQRRTIWLIHGRCAVAFKEASVKFYKVKVYRYMRIHISREA
ncbi:hypothetical protein FEM48_Zijuj10G0022500 [Ziziphus jujuba var. spinosa]|uniref:O-fucosyltransferase family protein n=1 Tax=Ziziphus jujuba var. spinosa TaxID=714518 RepID=A0A978UKP8_ZIZJJ|nr:hypothetical protein FEM48_Zijuj10G0022500 [Ziziphus jujuba var. spinosa]